MNNFATLDEIKNYRLKHNEARLVIDTNILLLFLIGIYDPEFLQECSLMTDNRRCYDKKHFELIKKILDIFLNRIIITPQVLSEIYSLSYVGVKPPRFEKYFEKIIKQLEEWEERHIEMKILLKNGAVMEFGFTDMSLIEVVNKENKWVVLTDEGKLQRVFRGEIPIINFNTIVTNELVLI